MEVFDMRASLLNVIIVFGCALGAAGCLDPGNANNGGGPDAGAPGGVGGGAPGAPGTPPATPAPPPASAPYVRGSLAPIYQLTPRAEYGRIQQNNISMADTDYQSTAVTVSSSQKMDEIGALPELLGGARSLIPDASDRQRANQIPFRGNPTDVKVLSINNVANVYVPLGGDVMTPGNE